VTTIGLGDSAMTRNVKSFNYEERNFTQGLPSYSVWRIAKHFESVCFFVIVFQCFLHF